MERLTERTQSAVLYTGRHTKLPGIDCAGTMKVAAVRECMERLAAYEDTGLTPEELDRLQKIVATLQEAEDTARDGGLLGSDFDDKPTSGLIEED